MKGFLEEGRSRKIIGRLNRNGKITILPEGFACELEKAGVRAELKSAAEDTSNCGKITGKYLFYLALLDRCH
jgi:hypothetical protein